MRHNSRQDRTGRRMRRLAQGGCLVVGAILLSLVVPATSHAASRDGHPAEPTARAIGPAWKAPTTGPERMVPSDLDGRSPSVDVPLPPGWTSTVRYVQSGSLLRDYVLVRPVGSATGPLPVLVVLHGRGMTPAGIARISNFPSVVGRAVVVYPAGYGWSWNAGGCCGSAHTAGIGDVSFLTAVVHDVVAMVPGTSDRAVYLVGFSNGGRMAYRMACADPALFAGVAAVEAVPVRPCDQSHPVSLAIVAYRNDPLLSISGTQPVRVVKGMVEPRVEEVVGRWLQNDGCTGNPSVRQLGTATVSTWSACRDGTRVQFDLYAGGSHHWPTGASTTPSASEVIWKFFH